jgi:hypothetical protein
LLDSWYGGTPMAEALPIRRDPPHVSHLPQKWYPHLEPMGRSSLLILSELIFILTSNCSPQVQPLSIPQMEMRASLTAAYLGV